MPIIKYSVSRNRSRRMPLADAVVDLTHAIRQGCRAGMQNVAELDFVNIPIAYGRNRIPAGPSAGMIGPKTLPAPRSDNDVRRTIDDLYRIGNYVTFSKTLPREFWEAIDAAGHSDQFTDPAYARDKRIIPLLEIDFCLCRSAARRGEPPDNPRIGRSTAGRPR